MALQLYSLKSDSKSWKEKKKKNTEVQHSFISFELL